MTEDAREYWEERAAILEYCGRHNREDAEFSAYLETCAKFDLDAVEGRQRDLRFGGCDE